MRRAAALALLVLALLGAQGCGPASVAAEPPADLQRWKAQTEKLRGLAFERPVELVRIDAARVRELIREEIGRSFAPEKARAFADAYAAIGVFPPKLPLFELLIELYGEQLVGLYDPRNERLYVREGQAPSGGYSIDVIAVHELVHALQHQHYPLTIGAQFGLENNDDLSTMLSVVTEGDASLAAFSMGGASHGGASVDAMAPARDAMMAEVERDDGPYGKAPRPLRLRLVAPYGEGLLLAARTRAKGGNAALDAWLRDPPLSTLPLVAPQGEPRPVEFVRLPLAWLEQQFEPRGCRVGHHDVVGPLMIAALLEEHDASGPQAVAGGWSGDRVLHVVCGASSELLWFTRWSTAEQAARFAAAYRKVLPGIAKRAGLSGVPEILLRERSALVRTRLFGEVGDGLDEKVEVRPYSSFGAWLQDGCFPDEGCPQL